MNNPFRKQNYGKSHNSDMWLLELEISQFEMRLHEVNKILKKRGLK